MNHAMHRPVVLALALASLAGCSRWLPFEDRKREARERFDLHKARFKYALALEQFEHGQIDLAYQSIRETLALHPDEPNYQLLLAKIQLEKGELAGALSTLRDVTYQGQPVAERHYICGLLAERYGRGGEALAHFEEARRLEPLSRDCLMAVAETMVQQGRDDEALALIDAQVHNFDGHWSLYALRGEILMMQGQASEAADSFAQALVQNAEDQQLALARGLALHDAGRHAEAASVLEALAEDLQPEVPVHLLRALGASRLEVGDASGARPHLRELTRRMPEDWLGWLLLARCELALLNPGSAVRAARQAAQLAPEQPGTLTLLGYAQLCAGDGAAAGRALQAAVQRDPQDALALCLLGQVAELNGSARRAGDYYDLALQIDPQDGLARHLRAALQTESGQSEPSEDHSGNSE